MSAARTVHAMAIGAWLRSTRELAGWSQAELAERAGLSQPVLSRMEAGRQMPDAYGMGRLAQAAGTDVGGLVAAVERTKAAMLAGARGLAGRPRAEWEELLPLLGKTSTAALALAAARAWLPGVSNPA